MKFLVSVEVQKESVTPSPELVADTLRDALQGVAGVKVDTARVLPYEVSVTGALYRALIRLRDLDVACSQEADQAAWAQAKEALGQAEDYVGFM